MIGDYMYGELAKMDQLQVEMKLAWIESESKRAAMMYISGTKNKTDMVERIYFLKDYQLEILNPSEEHLTAEQGFLKYLEAIEARRERWGRPKLKQEDIPILRKQYFEMQEYLEKKNFSTWDKENV